MSIMKPSLKTLYSSVQNEKMRLHRSFRGAYLIKASFAKITKNNNLQDATRFANLVAAGFVADIMFAEAFTHTKV